MKITLEHTEENNAMKVVSLTFVQPQKVGEIDSKGIDIIRIIGDVGIKIFFGFIILICFS